MIVGYTRYVELVKPLIDGKEIFTTGMTFEVERCKKALEYARSGKTVAVVCSGDAGIYGMAGLILQLSMKEAAAPVKIEVVPGIPAFVSAAAILGAPLMHDFASISLSDLLTDWDLIEKRVKAAAEADFVIALYNPKSSKRVEGLRKALSIISTVRSASTPVGIVRNATREGQSAIISTLGTIEASLDDIDMLTILIVGNSSTLVSGGVMITPRGYEV